MSLWKLYSLSMTNPHKRESLGACDELPWVIIFRLRINFRCVSDPIPKKCKISCWKSCE